MKGGMPGGGMGGGGSMEEPGGGMGGPGMPATGHTIAARSLGQISAVHMHLNLYNINHIFSERTTY